MIARIEIPTINANDAEVLIVRWMVKSGDLVRRGQPVCAIETTKSAMDLTAESDGYIRLLVEGNTWVKLGAPVAEIYATAEEIWRAQDVAPDPGSAGGVIVSRQAQELMRQHRLSPADFPGLSMIRAEDVRALIERRANAAAADRIPNTLSTIAPDAFFIYGTGSHAVVACETAKELKGPQPIGFLDFAPRQSDLCGLPVVHDRHLPELRRRGLRSVYVSLPTSEQDLSAFNKLLEMEIAPLTLIHPSAVVYASARIGPGNFIGPGVIIGPFVETGPMCRILNAASVAHHCKLGGAVRVSDGARLAGNVQVGDGSLIGIGATVNLRVRIGRRAILVSGVSVYDDVPDQHVVRADGKAYPVRPPANDRGA